ncbi:MAG: hypothetical protein WD873_02355, partial [Candidatus Hydrogenedentales bacterium]
PLQIIHCNAEPAVAKSRLAARGPDVSDATAEVIDAQTSTFDAFTDTEKAQLINWETKKNPVESDWDGLAKNLLQ